MNEFNDALFLLINASAQPNIFLRWTAKLLAEYAIWLIPLALVIGWQAPQVPFLYRTHLQARRLDRLCGCALLTQGCTARSNFDSNSRPSGMD